jgi:transcription initiation factor TFIID subunit 7
MEDELINVDGMSPPPPDGAATAASRLKLAVNGTRFNSPSERTTRSAAAAAAAAQRPPKRPPKVKLKLGGAKTTGNGNTSFLGPYDRELDSDDEDELAFEEQFILRMPPGEDCEKLRTMATSRSVKSDVWFRMKGKPLHFEYCGRANVMVSI